MMASQPTAQHTCYVSHCSCVIIYHFAGCYTSNGMHALPNYAQLYESIAMRLFKVYNAMFTSIALSMHMHGISSVIAIVHFC